MTHKNFRTRSKLVETSVILVLNLRLKGGICIDKPKLKLAVVEDSIDLAQLLTQFLSSLGRYEIVGVARDGERGLRLIQSLAVDVALIDLVLPGKDGFYILEELARQPEKKPVCIVLSGISLPYITAKAFEKGADYFVLKPFDLELLARRIDEVWEQKNNEKNMSAAEPLPMLRNSKNAPEDFVLSILHEIPISNTLNGYTFLKMAILLAIENPGLMEGITKRLYPAVAKRNNTTGQQVERAIRHAIDAAWQKGGGRNFVAIVGYGDPLAPKPTNSAFISAMVELYQHTYQ